MNVKNGLCVAAALVVLGLVALLGHVLGSQDSEERNRSLVTNIITSIGGKFEQEENDPDGPLVSIDAAGHTSLLDAALALLATQPKLKALGLESNTAITDAGLDFLVGMTQLQWLDLRGTRATPDGVERLKCALPSLAVVTDWDPPNETP